RLSVSSSCRSSASISARSSARSLTCGTLAHLRCQNPRTTPEGGCAMSWNLSGRYVETCSCDLMCPCNISFDHGATYDYCRATLCFDIEQGEIEGTDVGGLKFVAIIDSPKVMTEGNWKLGAFVDENASDEQM